MDMRTSYNEANLFFQKSYGLSSTLQLSLFTIFHQPYNIHNNLFLSHYQYEPTLFLTVNSNVVIIAFCIYEEPNRDCHGKNSWIIPVALPQGVLIGLNRKFFFPRFIFPVEMNCNQ